MGRVFWLGNPDVRSKIEQRRRQILVHSVIYYVLDDNIISDNTWSKWASELVELQKKYPDISSTCDYAKAFENFDGSTGFNLPLDDEWADRQAHYLLYLRDKKNLDVRGLCTVE